MHRNILELLVCPICQEGLKLTSKEEINGETINGTLQCNNHHTWKVEEGIINFESEEQTVVNNWSELYTELDYEKLDKVIKGKMPQMILDAQEIAAEELMNLLNKYEANKVLDIATGRGMLLTKLVEYYGDSIELVCIDLSFEVLKYDRIKTMQTNPDAKINYIACDATKLPFLNNAFDISVSFWGIQNMLNLASLGIEEGVRVSKSGLINIGTVIKDHNPKIDEWNRILQQQGYDFDVYSATESNFYNIHKIDEDCKVEINNIFEGIAPKNDNDLMPIEGEWFSIAIIHTMRG